MAQPDVIIDPNDSLVSYNTTNDVNLVPELQNLVPYVELVVYRSKYADFYIDKNGKVNKTNTQQSAVIPLMGFDPKTGMYENNFESDSYVYQNFGIKSITINVKAKFIPTVNIDFIDIQGQSTFNSNQNTQTAGYRSLFDFPPATYILKMKGVFGKTTRFDLHLLKVNSTFESTTGNFLIKCEFIGKSFVPLTDIKLGWLIACSRMKEYKPDTANLNGGEGVNNFNDLLAKLKILYGDVKQLENGDDVKVLTKNTDKINLSVEYQKALNRTDITNKTNSKPVIIYNTNDNDSFYNPDKKETNTYDSVQNTEPIITKPNVINYGLYYDVNVTELYTNKLTDFYKDSEKYFNTYKTKIQKYNDTIYSDLKIDLKVNDDIKIYYIKTQTNEYVNDTNVEKITIRVLYDYTILNKKIIDNSITLSQEITKAKSDLEIKSQNLINNTVGFDLNPENIFNVICNDTSEFLKMLKDSGDTSNEREGLVSTGSSNNAIQQDVPLFAYPRVINTSDGTTIYPGEIDAFKNWKEVQFVENFLSAYISVQQQQNELDNDNSKSDTSARKYIPVGTNDFSSLTYNNDYDMDSIFSKLFTKYKIYSQYTYKGFWDGASTYDTRTNPLFDFIGASESNNLIASIWDIKLLKLLKTNLQQIKNNSIKGGYDYFTNPSNVSTYTKTINTLTTSLNSNNDNLFDNNGNALTPNNTNTTYKGLHFTDKPNIVANIGEIDEKETPTKYFKQLLNGNGNFWEDASNYVLTDQERLISLTPDITVDNIVYFKDDKHSKDSYDSDFYVHDDGLKTLVNSYFLYNNTNNIDYIITNYSIKSDLETTLKQKFAYPNIVELPYNTIITIGNFLTIDKTYMDYLSINDRKFFIDEYNKYKTNLRDNILKELKNINIYYDYTIFDITLPYTYDTSGAVDFIKNNPSTFTYTLSLFDLKYVKNETSFTFLPTNEYNENTSFFSPIIKTTGQHSTLDNTKSGVNKIQLFTNAFCSSSIKLIDEKLTTIDNKNKEIQKQINDNDLKKQIYYSFKNMYDRWLADDYTVDNSNYSGQVNYISDIYFNYKNFFKFVDRSLNNIGGKMIIDVQPLVEASETPDVSLYTAISSLMAKNNFEFFPLPNLNTYDNTTNKWQDIFKININDVGVINNTTSFTCMYVGSYSTSKDDYVSFNNESDGSLLPPDYSLSDGSVKSFNINYGKQNQMIFQDIDCSTEEIKETGESLMLVDKILNSQGGSNTPVLKSQSLFEVYEKRGYKCEVTIPLGNTCLQPTTYFELRNIPMFNGIYIILEVSHTITSDTNRVSTKISGARVGRFRPRIEDEMFCNLKFPSEILNNITTTASKSAYNVSVKYVNPKYEKTKTNAWVRKQGKQTGTIVRYNPKTGEYILK